jgi:hypothetical protein
MGKVTSMNGAKNTFQLIEAEKTITINSKLPSIFNTYQYIISVEGFTAQRSIIYNKEK